MSEKFKDYLENANSKMSKPSIQDGMSLEC